MTYFQNIHSLADLKKEYRRLAMLHHPDKGGDTVLMQKLNTEFEKLFEIWKDRPGVSSAATGYEHDYQDATAREYTEYVYNEYRWKGRNYTGQSSPEITELVKTWLKETYPRYTFSVRRDGYSSILVRLMKADFEAFTKESGKVQGDINHYNIQASDSLTDRAKEVMTNVRDFVMSYNFDESDPMTDYFHTNFYLTLGIGSYRQPYRMELPKITGKDSSEVFRHPEGAAHKAMRQALGKARFGFIESRRHIGEMILGEDFYGSQGEHYFWPKEYSSAKTAQKRIGKLEAAGMRCELTGCNGGYIRLLGYTPETEKQSGTGKAGICHGIPEVDVRTRRILKYGKHTPEHFKSNQTDTIMTNREIIRELKRCGYSRVDIDTDSRAAKTFYTYRGGLHINGTEDLSFHIVPPQDSLGLGRFAICATRNGESSQLGTDQAPFFFRWLFAFLKGERKENEIIDEICTDRKTE